MSVRKGRMLEAEVCVVGAGPVGLVLAAELGRKGVETVLVESGGRLAWAARLNRGETIADPPFGSLHESRARGMGGTARLWNTHAAGRLAAKYAPLDAVDFDSREWIPFSGWPFRRAELSPYYGRAHEYAGLGPFAYEDIAPGPPHLEMSGALVNRLYRLGGADRFTQRLPTELAGVTTVQIARGTTVTIPVWSRDGYRVAALRARTRARTLEVRARRFVLAAGGIENARILLTWFRGHPVGPEPPRWLGRGFMEHPVDRSIQLEARTDLVHERSFYQTHGERAPLLAIMGRLGFDQEAILREMHLNASVRLTPLEPSRAPGTSASPIYQVFIDLEQAPHYENRVLLSNRRDSNGQPRASLHWRWNEADEASRVRVREIVIRELERAGAGRVLARDGLGVDPNAHHHCGTTRMHPDPTLGVVDTQLRVHGLDNVFAAGSSVFPTAGWANPTLTAIAVALRLAEHLSTAARV